MKYVSCITGKDLASVQWVRKLFNADVSWRCSRTSRRTDWVAEWGDVAATLCWSITGTILDTSKTRKGCHQHRSHENSHPFFHHVPVRASIFGGDRHENQIPTQAQPIAWLLPSSRWSGTPTGRHHEEKGPISYISLKTSMCFPHLNNHLDVHRWRNTHHICIWAPVRKV